MDNENINYSDYKYDFESKIVMNEQDYLDFNNVSYKRALFTTGEKYITHTTYFGEKIITVTKNISREFDYSSITGIYETEKYILLKLQFNLFLIIGKDIKSNINNVDFISYIFSKSPNIKKKVVINVTNQKKVAFVFMCLAIALFVINLIIAVLQKSVLF